jgi:Protocatechuate 3,4-dioxygenase beta subunit
MSWLWAPFAVADEPKPPERSMQVTVVGPDDKPVVGAKIHVSLWTKEPFKANRDFVCDAEGRTTFDLPKQIRILRLWASKENHVALFAQWWPEQEAAPRPIPQQFTFHLAKGTNLGGTVKNDDGKPIAGANVEVRLSGGDGGLVSPEPIPTIWLSEGEDAVKTDAEGKWAISNVPAGDVEVSLLLTHADYVSDGEWGVLQKEQGVTMKSLRDGTAIVVMHRGISVTGTVTDPDGKPVPDAIITWGEDPYFQPGSQETRTDKEGKYRTPPLAYGALPVTVIASGFAPQQEKIELPAQIAVFFQLTSGTPLRIHFIDDAGAPVPEVSVGIESWRGNKGLFNHKHPNVLDTKIPRQANKDGLYEWTWAPNDEVKLTFYKEGFRAVRGFGATAGKGPLAVKLEREP